MFLTGRERSYSSKKVYVPADKMLLEMMRTRGKEGAVREWSERKIGPFNFDLESRRTQVQTATRPKDPSPMELLSRKLQWRGRELRRADPPASDPKPLVSSKKGREPRMESILLGQLRGW
jgi:hypothetical protein